MRTELTHCLKSCGWFAFLQNQECTVLLKHEKGYHEATIPPEAAALLTRIDSGALF